MAAELLERELPFPWTYGVTGDGRVFFINEESRSTTWLHPERNHPVMSGGTTLQDLPQGWEQGVTSEQINYYIDHTNLRTTFTHPVTGDTEALAEKRHIEMDPARTDSKRQSKRKPKKKVLDSTPPVKRDEDAPVTHRGWLYFRQGGTKSWKKRWFVLADLCLFQYKDTSEQKEPVSSLMLPSYSIEYCDKQEESRKFSFKAEHRNMKTQYFAADSQDDMNKWMYAMSMAAAAQMDPSRRAEIQESLRRRHTTEDDSEFWPSAEETRQQNGLPHGGLQHPSLSAAAADADAEEAGFYPSSRQQQRPDRDDPYREQQRPNNEQAYSQQFVSPHQRQEDSDGFRSQQATHTDWSPDYESFKGSRDLQPLGQDRFQGARDPRYQDSHDPRYQEQERDLRYQDPRDPRYQDLQDPRHQEQERDPQYQDPRDSRYQDSQDPRYQEQERDPRYQDPRDSRYQSSQDPRYQEQERDPQYQDPRDSRLQGSRDPRYQEQERDPRYQDPRDSRYQDSQDPRYQEQERDPQHQDPSNFRYQDPQDPRSQAPRETRYPDSRDSRYQRPKDSRYGDPRDSRNLDESYLGSQHFDPKQDPRYSPSDPRFPMNDRDSRYGAQDADRRSLPADQQDPKYATQSIASAQQAGGTRIGYDKQQELYQQRQQLQTHTPESQKRAPSDPYGYSGTGSDAYGSRSLQKEDSVRQRLQEWQHDQRPGSISSLQRSPADKRPSDGPQQQRDNRYSDQMKENPRGPAPPKPQHTLSQHTEPSYQMMKVTVTKTPEYHAEDPTYENLKDDRTDPTVPLHVNVYNEEAKPQEPEPMPAMYRQQYIEQLADAKTPHTQRDMLASAETSRNRGNEPLYFRYPDQQPAQERGSYASSQATAEQRAGNQPPLQAQKYPDSYMEAKRRSMERHDASSPDSTTVKQPLSSQQGDRSSGLYDDQPRQRDSGISRQQEQRDSSMYRRDTYRDSARQSSSTAYGQQKREDKSSAHQPKERPDSVRYEDITYRQQREASSGVDMSSQFDRTALDGPQHGTKGRDLEYTKHLANKERKRLEKYIHRSNNRLSWNGILDGGKAKSTSDQVDGQARHSLDFELSKSQSPGSLQRGTKHHDLSDSKYDENQNYFASPSLSPAKTWKSLGSPDFRTEGSVEVSVSKPLRRLDSVGQLSPDSMTKLDKLDNENKLSESLGALELGAARQRELEGVGQGHRQSQHLTKWGMQHISDGLGHAGRANASMTYTSDGPRGNATSPGGKKPEPYQPLGYEMDAIKEDPDMADEDILTTRKLRDLQKHLGATTRLRLSISAEDLVGKSHEELVLLLIQLRRSHAQLENARSYFKKLLDSKRENEKEYKIKRKNSIGRLKDVVEREHDRYTENKRQFDEIEKQIEVHKPLINLLENMVTMGSLYGGDNLMLKSQYKRHVIEPDQYIPPKGMILFSRQHQENKLTSKQEQELKQLTEEEVDLEEKLQDLFKLDKDLQDRSFAVTSLQEDKELLEKALEGVRREEEMVQDPRDFARLAQQRQSIDSELTRVRQQLAEASRQLEETAAENAKVENEVILLRRKVYGLSRGQPSPTLPHDTRTRERLERELINIQSIMEGLSKQGERLSEVMRGLKQQEDSPGKDEGITGRQPFTETDMDTMISRDISVPKSATSGPEQQKQAAVESKSTALPNHYSGAKSYEDLNNKGFFSHQSPVLDRKQTPQQNRASSLGPQAASYGSPQGQVQGRSASVGPYPGSYQRAGQGSMENPYQSQSPSQGASPASQASYRGPNTRESSQGHGQHQGPDQGQGPGTFRESYPGYGSSMQTDRYDAKTVTQTTTASVHRSTPGETRAPPTDLVAVNEPKIVPEQRRRPQSSSMAYQKPTSEVHPQRQSSGGFARWQSPEGSPDAPTTQSAVQQPDALPVGNSPSLNQSQNPYQGLHASYDISEADDNTKRYYGLLPKEKPRQYTVRDIKKRETERRNRDRLKMPPGDHNGMEESPPAMQRSLSLPRRVAPPAMPGYDPLPQHAQDDLLVRSRSAGSNQDPEKRRSASQRLFPGGERPSTPSGGKSQQQSRHISDLYTPRPYGGSPRSSLASSSKASSERDFPRAEYAKPEVGLPVGSSYRQSDVTRASPTTVATVRPVVPATGSNTLMTDVKAAPWKLDASATITMAAVKPMSATTAADKRIRRKTISSTEPTKMEQDSPDRNPKVHSVAGDLISSRGTYGLSMPDYVKSESAKDTLFDMGTIDREVLYMPEKVDIPERYLPESNSEEDLTQEEKLLRQEKSNSIRRMLAAHSLQEWKESELTSRVPEIHQQVEHERRQRERILDIRQALAKEVTQRSREAAVEFYEKRKSVSAMEESTSSGLPNSPRSELNLLSPSLYMGTNGSIKPPGEAPF